MVRCMEAAVARCRALVCEERAGFVVGVRHVGVVVVAVVCWGGREGKRVGGVCVLAAAVRVVAHVVVGVVGEKRRGLT